MQIKKKHYRLNTLHRLQCHMPASKFFPDCLHFNPIRQLDQVIGFILHLLHARYTFSFPNFKLSAAVFYLTHHGSCLC